MSDSKVGYGNPPEHSRFKKGVSGNPKGPKRQPPEVGEVVTAVMEVAVEYREGGRTKKASRRELSIRRHLRKALKGGVHAAEALLKIRVHAQAKRDTAVQVVQVCDLLPNETLQQQPSDADPTDETA